MIIWNYKFLHRATIIDKFVDLARATVQHLEALKKAPLILAEALVRIFFLFDGAATTASEAAEEFGWLLCFLP